MISRALDDLGYTDLIFIQRIVTNMDIIKIKLKLKQKMWSSNPVNPDQPGMRSTKPNLQTAQLFTTWLLWETPNRAKLWLDCCTALRHNIAQTTKYLLSLLLFIFNCIIYFYFQVNVIKLYHLLPLTLNTC